MRASLGYGWWILIINGVRKYPSWGTHCALSGWTLNFSVFFIGDVQSNNMKDIKSKPFPSLNSLCINIHQRPVELQREFTVSVFRDLFGFALPGTGALLSQLFQIFFCLGCVARASPCTFHLPLSLPMFPACIQSIQALWKCFCCSCSDLAQPCLASASPSPHLGTGQSSHLPFVGVVCCLPTSPGKEKNNNVCLLQKVWKLSVLRSLRLSVAWKVSLSLQVASERRSWSGAPDPISAPVPFGAPWWQSHLSITHSIPGVQHRALAQFVKFGVV